jgi:hypothetical protein
MCKNEIFDILVHQELFDYPDSLEYIGDSGNQVTKRIRWRALQGK